MAEESVQIRMTNTERVGFVITGGAIAALAMSGRRSSALVDALDGFARQEIDPANAKVCTELLAMIREELARARQVVDQPIDAPGTASAGA